MAILLMGAAMISIKRRSKIALQRGGLGFAGLALGLSGFAAASESLSPMILAVSGGLTALGLAAALIGRVARTAYERDLDLRRVVAREDQIDDIHRKLEEFTGSKLVSLADRLAIWRRNPECFNVIVHKRANAGSLSEVIEGMIIAYPLGGPTWEQMKSGTLRGYELKPANIVRKNEQKDIQAIYISFVWGDDFTTRGYVIEELRELLRKWAWNDLVAIATRPTTSPALTATRNRSFHGIDGREPRDKEICWIEYGQLRSS